MNKCIHMIQDKCEPVGVRVDSQDCTKLMTVVFSMNAASPTTADLPAADKLQVKYKFVFSVAWQILV